ncbi:MAG: hypothetical protein HRU15_01365 [Planctomycetes bacterium]|nr:hypothetical protein [Planctomycetota bacterium]
MPHSSSKDRRRFWHPWIDNGLLPFLCGAVALPYVVNVFDTSAIVNVHKTMQSLLIISLTAAGLLVGTQLRLAYLHRAGWDFLRKQSIAAAIQALTVALPVGCLLFFLTDVSIATVIGSTCILAAFSMASSQRPMKTAIFSRHRSIINGHIVSCGWWNLLAIICGALGIALCFSTVVDNTVFNSTNYYWIMWFALPSMLGIVLGRLAVIAHNRDEAYVFMLAVVGICGGTTIALQGSPLLAGLLTGAAFVNVSLGRSALVERALEDLEHPVAVATGLFAGLCLPMHNWDWTWSLLAFLVIPLRMVVRLKISPTSVQVSTLNERVLASPGAVGVLLLGSLVLLPDSEAQGLIRPFVAALFVLTLVDEWWGSRALQRLQEPASGSLRTPISE